MGEYLKIFFIILPKAYWIKQASIPNTDQFLEYVHTVIPWLLSVGGTIIAKDIKQNSDLSQWDGGQLGVIVEFESKKAAQEAYDSDIFQEYLEMRDFSSDLCVSIIG
tara:strand:+ start:660 stop:980 length:321 start_codon:yes stop_codon:yes gene_type:complete